QPWMPEIAPLPLAAVELVLVMPGACAEAIREVEMRFADQVQLERLRLADDACRVMLRRQADPDSRPFRHDRRLAHERDDKARIVVAVVGGEQPDLAVEERKDGLGIGERHSMPPSSRDSDCPLLYGVLAKES